MMIPSAVLGTVISGVMLWYLATPYPWVALLWAAILVAGSIIAKRSTLKALFVNLAAVVVAFGAFETYLVLKDASAEKVIYKGTKDYYVRHELLGYGPAKGRAATVAKYFGNEQIYETVYTIEDNGLRVAPPPPTNSTAPSILFFGGSITFGEGVSDTEAMPYQVGVKAGGRYAIYNFAFHGYGPHQMLAALELGWVEEVIDHPPEYVVYQAIPAHVRRCAGLTDWDRHGPKYRLDETGEAVLAGHFDDEAGTLTAMVRDILDRSLAYRKILGRERQMDTAELELYVSVVRKARDFVISRFPGCQFHVILWDYGDLEIHKAIDEGLSAAGIPVHVIGDFLPEYTADPRSYELSSQDRHPNPRAHAAIADFVVEEILDRDW